MARKIQLLQSSERPVRFHGPTMEPFIRDGDRLSIKDVAFDTLRVGDIVCYHDGDRYPTRRIASIDQEAELLTLRCDNHPYWDFPVTASQVHGLITHRVRGAQSLSRDSLRWKWSVRLAPGRRFLRETWRRCKRRQAARRPGPSSS